LVHLFIKADLHLVKLKSDSNIVIVFRLKTSTAINNLYAVKNESVIFSLRILTVTAHPNIFCYVSYI